MSLAGGLSSLWRAHQRLPAPLRLYQLAPLAVLLAWIGGRFFDLPPGPLCDEGMVLFMEGGCDYGLSNVFFHSKLALLLALNIGFVFGWRRGVEGFAGFIPHFLVALVLAARFWTDEWCVDYYDHPNGSFGQMYLEVAAFAFLGIALLSRRWGRGAGPLALALLGWNLAGVGLFYLWLTVVPHWSPSHTALVAGSLLVAGVLVRRFATRRMFRGTLGE